MNEPQSTLRHVLAATDFSLPATQALQRAARLVREHGAHLVVAHVLSQGGLDDLLHWLRGGAQWALQLHDQADASLASAVNALGVNAVPELLDGAPVPALCGAALRHGADLTVIGARGENPLHQRLLGGTAERLLRKSPSALLVVRQPAQRDYQSVLVPVDFSAWSLQAVRLARRVAPQASLVLHHSFVIPFEEKLRFAGVGDDLLSDYRERARTEARDGLLALASATALDGHDHGLSLGEGDAPQRILDVAKARHCDLIVIGKHGRGAAEELLLGSVTRQVLEEAEVDVLVSQAHAD